MKRLLPIAAVVLLASSCAGCGQHHAAGTRPLAARWANRSIGWDSVRTRESYVMKFYRDNGLWPSPPHGGCKRLDSGACREIERQVVARLIEEAAIAGYAQSHDITLTRADRARVANEVKSLTGAAGSSSAFGLPRQDRSLVRTILATQILVQQVEKRITAAVPRSGPSVQITSFAIPAHGREKSAMAAAARLATDGSPIPPGTRTRTEWRADFRISARENAALADAQPGQFIGPFPDGAVIRVIELLRRGRHRYGKPAYERLVHAAFQRWLSHQIREGHPRCYTPEGQSTPCPV